MSLGDEIRIARQKAFYTQEDLARKLGVSLSTVNRWEQNKARPSAKTMKLIKTFCRKNDLDYEPIEDAWLYDAARRTEIFS